ncbi:Outer membrane protein [Myxococcus hansupus]|uniref:Outer membrane protein n=1 Tax=Pseudomyxococcus hansupus TaxID=1297742 RepID=A0A0H4WLT9_9BACT|nr:carboxypeptidase regulatory-like domain-containing protein [Myxococcus hansupus]AKQ63709.1 Outer membrane protein [Myxococcus hansupus]
MKLNRLGALAVLVLAFVALPACDGEEEAPDVRPGSIAGQVELDDGAPPEGVSVRLFDTGAETTTGEDGAFTFANLPPGTYTLSAFAVGYEVLQQEVEVEAAKATSVPLTLKLVRSQVSGTILLEGATTHEGITVALQDSPFTTTTDAAGHFVLEGVPTGAYILEASKEGYDTVLEVVALTSEPETVSLTLEPTGHISISGLIILQSGSDSSGATVMLEGTAFSTTTVNEYGSFSLKNVPPGVYTLVASKEGYVTQSEQVTVVEGDTAYVLLSLEVAAGLMAPDSSLTY